MAVNQQIHAAQIQAAAALTASVLGHVAPKWDEGRATVQGLSTFALDLYKDILDGIMTHTQQLCDEVDLSP